MTSEHAETIPAKTIASWVLCALVGLTFIGAAFAKFTYTVQLEKDILNVFGILESGWNPYIAILARLLIVAELALGLALFQPYWRKRLIIPLTMVVIAGFIVYLVIIPADVDNCGCMGTWIEMTPKQSLVKNILLCALAGAAWICLPRDPKGKLIIPFLFSVVSTAMVFGIVPVKPVALGTAKKDFSSMAQFQGETRSLKEGIALLCFFNANCEHCMETADLVANIRSQGVELYFAINGTTEEITTFREDVSLTNVPFLAINSEDLLSNVGNAPPRVYLLRDGKAVAYWDGIVDPEAVRFEIQKLND